MNNSDQVVIPGYKQPWFWFLMAPLVLVFIMGFTMLYLSIVSSDGVVADNFYKDGLAIHTRMKQDAAAGKLALEGTLSLSGQQVSLILKGNLDTAPDALTLQFIYPTKSSEDIVITLIRADNGFVGALAAPISGRYQVMLSPKLTDASQPMWRLHGIAIFPLNDPLALLPK